MRETPQGRIALAGCATSGVDDPHKRVVIRLVLTATAAQHDAVLGEFQDFVRTVRPDNETEA